MRRVASCEEACVCEASVSLLAMLCAKRPFLFLLELKVCVKLASSASCWTSRIWLLSRASLPELQECWRFRERWRYRPLPQALRQAVLTGDEVEVAGVLSELGGSAMLDQPSEARSLPAIPLSDTVRPGIRLGGRLANRICQMAC